MLIQLGFAALLVYLVSPWIPSREERKMDDIK